MRLPAPPLPGDWSLTSVELHRTRDRSDAAPETLTPEGPSMGDWSIDTTEVADGRWWAKVVGERDGVPGSYRPSDPIDLPYDERLAISPEALAVSMRIPLPLGEEARDVLTQAIIDAQADVTAYLQAAILPVVRVERGVYPYGDTWDLQSIDYDEVIEILSVAQEQHPLGGLADTWTITYRAGLDAKNDPECEPIRRYLRAHAANLSESVRLWESTVKPEKIVKSASTQGQSVSYERQTLGGGGAAGSGAAGALPTLSSLDNWRVAGRNVYQGATQYGRRYYGA